MARSGKKHSDLFVAEPMDNVINGKIKGRENDEEIIVYETVGVAAQDLVAAKVIYDKAVEAGKGLRWGE